MDTSRWRRKGRAGAAIVLAGATSLAAVGAGDASMIESPGGGTLRVGRVADIVSTDGHVLGAANHTITDNVYARLIEFDDNVEPVGVLAEQIEVNDDATEFTVHLRDAVTFHDGSPITAEVVAANLERVADPDTGAAQIQGLAARIDSVDIVDDQTLVVRYPSSTRAAFDLFNMMAIVDPATIGEAGAVEGLVTNGSGPFKLVDWSQGQSITFERFEDYWDYRADGVDRVEIRILGDPDAMVIELEVGSIDVAEMVRPEDAGRVQDAGFVNVVNDRNMFQISLNMANAPFDDQRARQAFNYSIDRQRIASEVLAGLVEPTALPWPRSHPFSTDADADAYQFDLERASALFAEAGVAEGASIELVTNAAQPALRQMATIIQADLASIGIDLSIRDLAPPEWRPLAFDGAYQHLIAAPMTVDYTPGAEFSVALALTPDRNYANLDSQPELYDEFVSLIATLEAAPTSDAALAAAEPVRAYLLDTVFMAPVAPNPQVVTHSDDVSGIRYRIGSGGVRFDLAVMS